MNAFRIAATIAQGHPETAGAAAKTAEAAPALPAAAPPALPAAAPLAAEPPAEHLAPEPPPRAQASAGPIVVLDA